MTNREAGINVVREMMGDQAAAKLRSSADSNTFGAPIAAYAVRYNEQSGHIREIKPDNARGVKSGEQQLQRYKAEMEKTTGKAHTTELTKYPPPKP